MALEDAILKLAEAIMYHAGVQAQALNGGPQLEKPLDVPTKGADTKKSKTSDASSASDKSATVETTPESATGSTTSPSKEEIDVPALKEKFASIVEKDTPKAKEILTEMGFPKFGLVPANLHAKLQGLVDAALVEIEAANG